MYSPSITYLFSLQRTHKNIRVHSLVQSSCAKRTSLQKGHKCTGLGMRGPAIINLALGQYTSVLKHHTCQTRTPHRNSECKASQSKSKNLLRGLLFLQPGRQHLLLAVDPRAVVGSGKLNFLFVCCDAGFAFDCFCCLGAPFARIASPSGDPDSTWYGCACFGFRGDFRW